MGISQQQVDLRAQELQQQAALQGRSLDIEQARSEADIDLRTQQLIQQASLQGRSLDLDEARLQAQQDQFNQSLEEQRAGRLQQLGVSTRDLDLRAQQLQQEAKSQDKTLELQDARDKAEASYRLDALAQEAELRGEAFDIDRQRLIQEAKVESDRLAAQREQFYSTLDAEESQFARNLAEQEAQRLQNLGISEDELNLRAQQIQNEYEQRGESLDIDRARLDAEIDFRAEQFMRDDRTLDLQEARDLATERINDARLAEETAARMARDGFSQQDLNLRATQIADDARLRGQEITSREAIAEAERTLQRERLAQDLTMQGIDIASREGIATLDRQTQEYITDQRELTNRARIDMEKDQFTRDLSQRSRESQAQLELSRISLLTQLAQLLGVPQVSEVWGYSEGAGGE